MGKEGFKELKVWQKAKDLAIEIYKMTNQGKLNRDPSLRDHIRRSAVSIPSNIAEGDERDTDRESIRFFYISKGSLAELRTQLEIAHGAGFIERAVYNKFDSEYFELGRMIGRLIKIRQATGER